MDKYKKLMSNTMIFAIGQFGAKLLSFFLVRLYTAALTQTEYGKADLLYQTLNVLVPIVTFSMSDAVIRFGLDKGYDKRKVYTNANVMTLIGMTVFALTTPFFERTTFYHGYTMLLYVYCFFSCFRMMASQYVRTKGMVKLFALDGIFATLTQFLCNLLFMLVFKLGITGYVLSFIVSDLISLIGLAVFGKLSSSFDTRFINTKLMKEMLRYSAPLIPTYLLWWITSASDRWFVIKMVGEDADGVYAVAYKLPTLLMMVTTMFYQAWQMSSIEEKDSRTIGNFYKKVYSAYSAVMFTAAAFLMAFAFPLTDILTTGDSYLSASLYTVILVEAMVFQCMCQFLSSIYSVRKKSVNSAWTAFIAAAVNVLLNFLLIPKYQVYGAAVATASSYFACFAVRIFDARRFIPFRVNYGKLGLNILLMTVMCIVCVKKPAFYILWMVILLVLITVLNISAVLNTVGRFRNRRNSPAPAQQN